MATRIVLQHKDTGLIKTGYYDFSWTTLFFGFMPALFRGDFKTFFGAFAVTLIIGLVTVGIGTPLISLVWAFMYNKYYTRKLLEQGYILAGSHGENSLAATSLGIPLPASRTPAISN